jgi:hypothetical protein
MFPSEQPSDDGAEELARRVLDAHAPARARANPAIVRFVKVQGALNRYWEEGFGKLGGGIG